MTNSETLRTIHSYLKNFQRVVTLQSPCYAQSSLICDSVVTEKKDELVRRLSRSLVKLYLLLAESSKLFLLINLMHSAFFS